MKLITCHLVVSGLLGLTFTCCAVAQDSATTTNLVTYPTPALALDADDHSTTMAPRERTSDDRLDESPLYRKCELDVDLFGAASIGEQAVEHPSTDRFRHRGFWGGGGGVTAFFCRYVGIGGDYIAETHSGRFTDSASGNIYLRLPLFNTGLAPYVYGGGGYEFEGIEQSFVQGGGGLEYRFCKNLGIFADGRYVIADKAENFVQVRAGVRIAF